MKERAETVTVLTPPAKRAGVRSPVKRSAQPPEDPVMRERTRLAYALHDGLTQVVTASVLDLEWLARRVDIEPEQATEALRQAARELRGALEEIRDMLATMSPEAPSGAERLEELVRGLMERWRLPATWSIEGDVHAVPSEVLDSASAVIREAVANAAKHAGSGEVRVRVTAGPDALDVLVEDRGRGFRPAEISAEDGHLGLEMMRRRVVEQGGRLDIESSPGNGTRVVARLPVRSQGAEP